jgi:Glucodextranase, domain N
MSDAPSWTGIPLIWKSSAKTNIGTALSQVGRVWFTTSHGILKSITRASATPARSRPDRGWTCRVTTSVLQKGASRTLGRRTNNIAIGKDYYRILARFSRQL